MWSCDRHMTCSVSVCVVIVVRILCMLNVLNLLDCV